MKLKRQIGFVMVALFTGVIVLGSYDLAQAEEAHPKVSVDVLTAGFGFLGHISMLSTSQIAKKYHPWLRIRVAETPGYVYNLEKLESYPSGWHNTIIESGDWGIWLARNQITPFTTKVLGMKKLLTQTTFGHMLVSTKGGMQNLGDAVGKKIALGTKSQTDYYAVPRLLIDKGWGLLDKLSIQWIGHVAAMQAMQDGLVDVIQININLNPDTGQWQHQPMNIELLGAGKKIYYIDYATPEVLDKLKKNTGLKILTYKLPKGTLEYQDRDVTLLLSPSTYAVKDVFPEELAYEFVKLYLDHYKEMGEMNKYAKNYSPGLFTVGLTQQNTHPGALQAYEEAGITIPAE